MARNKELNEKIKDERKEQILANALRLFAAKGLAATKITDISSASGISQGLIYHYYRSKEEIFVELIRTAIERMNAAALELEKMPIPPREKIKTALETMLETLEERESYARYFLLIVQANVSEAIPEEAKSIISKNNDVPYEVITRIFREGQKDGSFKKHEPEEMALVFWTTIKGLAIYRAEHGEKFKAPDSKILMGTFLA